MVLATTALDRQLGIVISLTGLGRWSEGDNYIDRVEASVHRAVTGEELARRRDPCARGPCRFPVLHAIEGGAVLGFAPEDADPDAPPRTIVLAGTGRYDPAHRPRLECQQELCAIRYAEGRRSVRVRGPRRVEVTFASGEQATVELDAAHAWHRAAEVSYGGFAAPDGARALFVATHESISFDWTPGHGAAAISRVEQGGEATLLLGGRGPVAIERAPDGSFYLQVGGGRGAARARQRRGGAPARGAAARARALPHLRGRHLRPLLIGAARSRERGPLGGSLAPDQARAPRRGSSMTPCQ
ncbi:MAG: hypothetical protein M5U28_29930 [Sandaracinaceae bacterium]|nr:hypothetical protein [Sandaracinaceae bacterium]